MLKILLLSTLPPLDSADGPKELALPVVGEDAAPGRPTLIHHGARYATILAQSLLNLAINIVLLFCDPPSARHRHDVFQSIGHGIIADQVRTHRLKADLLAPLKLSVAELWRYTWVAQRRLVEEEDATLLHGDCHVGNTYILPNGGAGLLDWQLSIRGCWAHDVTYLLVTSLSPEERRTHQRELLEHYLRELEGQPGVEVLPSFDRAWSLYRRCPVWGLVIGWLICPPENYGADITTANITRLVEACRDLDSFAAIDET